LNTRPIAHKFKELSADANNICLLCSEPKSDKCHRKLIAEYISNNISNITIIHL
jgi:hypothetical protein